MCLAGGGFDGAGGGGGRGEGGKRVLAYVSFSVEEKVFEEKRWKN